MSDGVCHLCFNRSEEMIYCFQQNVENTQIQEFVETFCQFVFNVSVFFFWIFNRFNHYDFGTLFCFQDSTCSFEDICLKCWHTLNNFSQFCEKIRGIHHNLVEVSCATGSKQYEEHTEILEEVIEEDISTEDVYVKDIPLLSIESDLGDEEDNFARRCE